jgi:hypothetical protein
MLLGANALRIDALVVDVLEQGWTNFLASGPNSREKKFRGPKSGSKGPWQAKFLANLSKQIFCQSSTGPCIGHLCSIT